MPQLKPVGKISEDKLDLLIESWAFYVEKNEPSAYIAVTLLAILALILIVVVTLRYRKLVKSGKIEPLSSMLKFKHKKKNKKKRPTFDDMQP